MFFLRLSGGPVEAYADVTSPNGAVTSDCYNRNLRSFDNQGNVIRHIPRTPQVHYVDNCVRQPQSDARGDLYGILQGSDYLVGYSKTGLKWSKKLNCSNTFYTKKVAVGGNGRIYTFASVNGELRIWGISPNITLPAVEPGIVDNFVVPGSCSDYMEIETYKHGLVVSRGIGDSYTYYSYAGKELHTPPQLSNARPRFNAEGDAFYYFLNQRNKREVRKVSARYGSVAWTFELPNESYGISIHPTADAGAIIYYRGLAVGTLPSEELPYVNQTDAYQLIFLNAKGERTRTLFVRQPAGKTSLYNTAEVDTDVRGNAIVTLRLTDFIKDQNGREYQFPRVGIRVINVKTGETTHSSELKGDLAWPSPGGYQAMVTSVTDGIVYLVAECRSYAAYSCNQPAKLYPIAASMVSMDYPRGAVLASGTAAQPKPLRYVALGDSYASGQGTGQYLPGTNVLGGNTCQRSYRSYPRLMGLDPIRHFNSMLL